MVFGERFISEIQEKNLKYNLTAPNGNIIKPPANGWRWSKERMAEMIERKEVIFSKDNLIIIKKTYLVDQKGLSPSTVWSDIQEKGHNRQAKYELKKLFPEVNTSELFKTPKPERLVARILEICTNEKDIVLDSFLGSEPAVAVSHKMNRNYIGVEMGEHAKSHCQTRLKQVVDGEQGGVSESVEWKGGGGFHFYRLGSKVFDEFGVLNSDIKFQTLAAHVWYLETRIPLTKKVKTPYLGEYKNIGYFLLYNGILGDKRPQGGNVLTHPILESLQNFDGPKIIYGETTRIGQAKLKALNITFKQIPYDVKAI